MPSAGPQVEEKMSFDVPGKMARKSWCQVRATSPEKGMSLAAKRLAVDGISVTLHRAMTLSLADPSGAA